jgi:phosphopantetheine adenylyltransferase
MKQNQQVLSTLLKTIQMGQVDIRSVLDTTMRSSLRNTLKDQLQEYDSIETEAYTIALQRGWDLSELDPGRRFLRDRMTRMKINGPNTDSRIADILIQRNTRGMIRGLRNLHQFEGLDHQIRILSQKLLDCETAHIRQMQSFL